MFFPLLIILAIVVFLSATDGQGGIPLSLVSPTATPALEEGDSDPTLVGGSEFVDYSNDQYRLSLRYPQKWQTEEPGQIFEQGDLLYLKELGKSQPEGTELVDGVLFALGVPVKKTVDQYIEDDLERIEEKKEFFYGGKTFFRVISCGLSCTDYYLIRKNDLVFPFAAVIEGENYGDYREEVAKILTSLEFKVN